MMNPLDLSLRLLARDQLSVFLFHKVPLKADDLTPYDLALPLFERMLDFIAERFQVLPLEDAAIALEQGKLPRGAACITFDDGYPGWLQNVAPALERRGMHATFFITSGQFEGEPMWHERVIHALQHTQCDVLDLPGLGLIPMSLRTPEERRTAGELVERFLKYLPLATRSDLIKRIEVTLGTRRQDVPCMALQDLRDLHNRGFAIGGHTIAHPILSLCEPAHAEREIGGVREWLQGVVRGPVNSFAYPNGRPIVDFSADHVAMVRRAGYKCAVTTQWGGAGATSFPFQIPRFTPWGPDRLRMALQVGRNLMTRPRLISLPPMGNSSEAIKPTLWPPRPIRVLFVENGAGFGGAVIALQTLLSRFSPSEIEAHVATNLPVGKFDEIQSVKSNFVIRDRVHNFRPLAQQVGRWKAGLLRAPVLFALGRIDDLVNRFPYLLKLVLTAIRVRPDAIHGNNEPNANREAMLVAKLLRKPYVQHVRGPLGDSRHTPWLLARPSVFIPVSRWLAGDLVRAGVPGERVRQIYDGVNLDIKGAPAVPGKLRRELGIAPGKIVVAMVGMLVAWKGQEHFIEAASILCGRRGIDVAFLIVGGLPERGDASYQAGLVEKVERAGLRDSVIFCGRRDDLPALLPEMDVVVSASTEPEPLGLVMLEAMASGCFFIAPAFGAATEVVRDGENGFLFTPRSPESLAEKIAEAIGKLGERDAIAERGRAAVTGQFGAEECARSTARIHRTLLQGAL